MSNPIYILQIDARLSEKDSRAIQEALDMAYKAGYDNGFRDGKQMYTTPNTYPGFPTKLPIPPYIVNC